jgi:hypothetical protein
MPRVERQALRFLSSRSRASVTETARAQTTASPPCVRFQLRLSRPVAAFRPGCIAGWSAPNGGVSRLGRRALSPAPRSQPSDPPAKFARSTGLSTMSGSDQILTLSDGIAKPQHRHYSRRFLFRRRPATQLCGCYALVNCVWLNLLEAFLWVSSALDPAARRPRCSSHLPGYRALTPGAGPLAARASVSVSRRLSRSAVQVIRQAGGVH